MAKIKRDDAIASSESTSVEVNKKIEVNQDAIADEPKTVQVEHDLDANTVTFQVNGRSLTLREPLGKDFLLLEAWMRQAPEDYRDIQIMMVKLASLCSVDDGDSKKIGFQNLFDSLITLDDVEVVGTAIGFFRDSIGKYFTRLAKRAGR
jgi:hypothetical protein